MGWDFNTSRETDQEGDCCGLKIHCISRRLGLPNPYGPPPQASTLSDAIPKAGLTKPRWVVRGRLNSIIQSCEENDPAASVPEQLLSGKLEWACVGSGISPDFAIEAETSLPRYTQ